MIKYACDEHIEDAMDDVINESETFPLIEKVYGSKCSYCDKKSTYEVKLT